MWGIAPGRGKHIVLPSSRLLSPLVGATLSWSPRQQHTPRVALPSACAGLLLSAIPEGKRSRHHPKELARIFGEYREVLPLLRPESRTSCSGEASSERRASRIALRSSAIIFPLLWNDARPRSPKSQSKPVHELLQLRKLCDAGKSRPISFIDILYYIHRKAIEIRRRIGLRRTSPAAGPTFRFLACAARLTEWPARPSLPQTFC